MLNRKLMTTKRIDEVLGRFNQWHDGCYGYVPQSLEDAIHRAKALEDLWESIKNMQSNDIDKFTESFVLNRDASNALREMEKP